jgi:acetyl-CoA carboxylase carboxyltransferase component
MTFSWEEGLRELADRRERALQMGGAGAVARQHSRGKMTIRERIDLVADPGSFKEIGTLATYPRTGPGGRKIVTSSSFVCGLARVDGRPVAVGGQDYTVSGGVTTSYLDRVKGEYGGLVEDLAHEYRVPFLYLTEGVGGGSRIDDVLGGKHNHFPTSREPGVNPAAWYYRSFELLQEVPVLTAILGPTAGFCAARTVVSHFTVMTRKTAAIFVTGPDVVRGSLGSELDMFELGGAEIHTTNGDVDNIAEDDADAIRQLQAVLAYLPQNVWEVPPVVDCDDPIDRRTDEVMGMLPENSRKPYDVRSIIETIVDRGSFFEIGRTWGRAVVQGLARIGGMPFGIVANNPQHIAGALDREGCDKQTRFVEFCNTFHLPLVFLVDSPGFMIGAAAERSGIARSAMRAVEAIFFANVPIITIHTRKAFGMGPLTNCNPTGLNLRLAWPSAVSGGMPAEGAIDVMFKQHLEQAPDRAALRQELIEAYRAKESLWSMAEALDIEEVIHPGETREYVGRFLEVAWGTLKTKLGPPKQRPRI